MSGAMENRAAVFTSQPQDIEVYRNGAWWPGSLLGWRHDSDGGCRVWVRLVAGAAEEETTWTALDHLRLPESEGTAQPVRHLSTVEPELGASSAGDVALTGTMTAIRAVPVPATRPGAASPGRSELTATMALPAVRDLADDPVAATSVPAGSRAGGRHRAPARESGASGRHRADTGVRPAVRADGAAGMPPASSPTRSAPAAAFEGSDAHLFTRPMRLDDVPGRMPRPRRAHRDVRPAGR